MPIVVYAYPNFPSREHKEIESLGTLADDIIGTFTDVARILGITIPENKKILYALTYIYGVGQSSSALILKSANVNPDKRAKDLSDEELNKIQKIVERSYKVEGDLRREVGQNVKRLKEIGTWRGLRHAKKLPIHGRSKTNSRTLRGNVRKTMGSGRKSSNEKT